VSFFFCPPPFFFLWEKKEGGGGGGGGGGHVLHTGKNRKAQRILMGKPERNKLINIPRLREKVI